MTTTSHTVAIPFADIVHEPTPESEMRRRWSAVREEMARADLDLLIFGNQNDGLGGYTRWLCDLAVGSAGYPISGILPQDDDMTLVVHGPIGSDRHLDPSADPGLRGVRRMIGTASFTPAAFTATDDAALLAGAIADQPHRRVGLVGWGQLSYPAVSYWKERFPETEFVEASDVVDRVKAIKSDQEIGEIRRAARMQDDALEHLAENIRPGMRDSDAVALVADFCQRAGSDAGILMSGSGGSGVPARMSPRRFQNRVIQPGDHLVVLIERNGPSGQYTELGRALMFGEVSDAMRAEFAFTLELQDFAAGQLRAGAAPAELFREYNEFLVSHGRPPETRLHAHGQGYDLVERPLIRDDETMMLAERMNLAVHPSYEADGVTYYLCDNYLMLPGGGIERVHASPREIVEVR
jgi:Xaa-Pro aminopeptidase